MGGPRTAAVGQAALAILVPCLRVAPLTLRLPVLRAMFRPRPDRVCDLTDRQLHDIGLSRDDARSPHGRTPRAETDIHRLLGGHGWR